MRRVLKAAAAIAGIAALVIVVILGVGYRLPESHVVTRSAQLAQPPDSVYDAIRDVASYPAWRPDVRRVDVLDTGSGPLRFREHAKQGSITYELVEDDRPVRMRTRIVDEDLGFSGSWTYDLQEQGGGTTVSITETGVVTNPLFRFMSRYVFGHTATIDAYLEALSDRFDPQ